MSSTVDLKEASLLGLVLAGGESRRMGEDKGGLHYQKKSQIEVCHDLLQPLCKQIYLSCRKDQWGDEQFSQIPRIYDDTPGMGPISGILSAMRRYPNSAWLVVAVDLPFLRAEALKYLVAHRDQTRWATAFRSGRSDESVTVEPVCTIYEPASYTALQKFFADGKRSLVNALAQMPVATLDSVYTNDLTNANSPEERQMILAQLSQDPKSEK